MVGRHHHDHGRAQVLCAAAALGADLGAEVRGGHNHRHAARHMFEDGRGQHLALLVRQHKLLGEVGEYAQAGRSRVNHEIDAALLAREVQLARVGEGGGYHRKHALVPGSHGAHSTMLKS